ncbi:MAG: cereblon family protein [Pseudomonadota bacterium]
MADEVADPPVVLEPELKRLLDAVADDERRTEDERFICCARCNTAITRPDNAIAINGQHRHFCVNPHGFEFDVGCFETALGCAVTGQPSHADSWFAGYFWRYAHCSACEQHLGWYFEGQEPAFFGLIRDRVVG